MFYIVLCGIAIYFLSILAVKYSKSVSLDESQKVVNKFMKKYLQEFWLYLFPNQQAAQNWLADQTLVQNLLTVQENFNTLPRDFTKYLVHYYNGSIPCVSIQFIPKAGISEMALKTALGNVVFDRLVYCNVTDPFVHVIIKSLSHNEQVLHILYGVTDLQKQKMQELLSVLNQYVTQKACQVATPPVDKTLVSDISNGNISKNNGTVTQIGFDAQTRVPIDIDFSKTGMVAVVGGTGSGKSVAVLYLLYKLKKTGNSELYLADFKRSGDFIGISPNYAEAEAVTDLIEKYYDVFLNTPEDNPIFKLLLVDEYAGYVTWLTQQDKKKADEIRGKISTILMMGRSRRCFVWCVQQRISATLFPSGIGAIDNFQVCIGMGRLSPDSRKSLFAGEHLKDTDFEDSYNPGTGQGLILVDGQPLRALQIPFIEKKELHDLLTS